MKSLKLISNRTTTVVLKISKHKKPLNHYPDSTSCSNAFIKLTMRDILCFVNNLRLTSMDLFEFEACMEIYYCNFVCKILINYSKPSALDKTIRLREKGEVNRWICRLNSRTHKLYILKFTRLNVLSIIFHFSTNNILITFASYLDSVWW